MTENALSILIVIFSVQTEISDRKLFIFQHGSRTVNGILLIKQYFQIKITNNLQRVGYSIIG